MRNETSKQSGHTPSLPPMPEVLHQISQMHGKLNYSLTDPSLFPVLFQKKAHPFPTMPVPWDFAWPCAAVLRWMCRCSCFPGTAAWSSFFFTHAMPTLIRMRICSYARIPSFRSVWLTFPPGNLRHHFTPNISSSTWKHGNPEDSESLIICHMRIQTQNKLSSAAMKETAINYGNKRYDNHQLYENTGSLCRCL